MLDLTDRVYLYFKCILHILLYLWETLSTLTFNLRKNDSCLFIIDHVPSYVI